MKTTSILIVSLALMLSFNGCKKSDSLNLYFTVMYGGVTHSFDSDVHMYVYQSGGYTILTGKETSTGDVITAHLNGITTGEYKFGSNNNSLNLLKGTYTYTNNSSNTGSLWLNSMDQSKMYATGTFDGTIKNTVLSTDVLSLSSGTFGVKYEF